MYIYYIGNLKFSTPLASNETSSSYRLPKEVLPFSRISKITVCVPPNFNSRSPNMIVEEKDNHVLVIDRECI